MAYNPAETTDRDRIRGLLGDDGTTAIMPDERYDTWLARYPDDWRLAAIDAGKRLLIEVSRKPVSIGDEDGNTIRWSDKRISALEGVIADLIAEVAADSYGEVVTISAPYLTGCTEGDARW